MKKFATLILAAASTVAAAQGVRSDVSRLDVEAVPTLVPVSGASQESQGTIIQLPPSPPRQYSAANWDLGVFVQGGNGLEDRTSYHFLSAGAYLGRILTDDHTSLKANFEYGVEVLPLWQSYTPKFNKLNCTAVNVCSAPTPTGGTYRGVSVVPIVLRINMLHGAKFQPWLQGAGGLIYTSRKYPPVGNLNPADLSENGPAADTSVWNFDPQFGIGAHYFVKPRRSIDFSANAVHISSSSLGDKNPGVNTGVQFTAGYSWWK